MLLFLSKKSNNKKLYKGKTSLVSIKLNFEKKIFFTDMFKMAWTYHFRLFMSKLKFSGEHKRESPLILKFVN